MALSNLLESYISSIDSFSNSLDGLDDHLCHETYSEIKDFYKILDDSHSANEYLERNSFTDDCAAINKSLLSKCNDCYASLEQYREQEGQSIEGYKKIVSVASNKRLKLTLAEYEQKIEQVEDRQNEISECKTLIERCEIELAKNNLIENSKDFILCKEYLESIQGLTHSSADQFIESVNILKIKESRQILEKLLDSSHGFEKSLLEHNKSKKELEDELNKKKVVLSSFITKLSKYLLNPKSKAFVALISTIDDTLNKIIKFEYKTLDPNSEFRQAFETEAILNLNNSFLKIQNVYNENIKYIENVKLLNSECISLLLKCQAIFTKYNLDDQNEEFLSFKSHSLFLSDLKESKYHDFDCFKSSFQIAKLAKTKTSLEKLLEDSTNSQKDFSEYCQRKNEIIEFLKNKQQTLNPLYQDAKIKLKIEKLKIENVSNHISELLNLIESFQVKTLKPLKEFESAFKTAKLKKSIDSMVAESILEMNSELKKKRLMVAIFIAAILLGLIVMLNPSILDSIIQGLQVIGLIIVALVLLIVGAVISEQKKDK
jgi:hypothetical protein